MASWSFYYLVRIEFLGFRYHGWQKQEKLPSVQGMVDKTLLFILENSNFKTLGCGRTDAKVSADDFAFELFINEKQDCTKLLSDLNANLPADIKAVSVNEVDGTFNIIQHSKNKEYHYHFSIGEKSHPFNTPLIRHLGVDLDIEKMKLAALEFQGKHDFKRYAAKSNPKESYVCDIELACIEQNTKYTGAYTPKNSYVFKVRAKGFMRYQVRLMMGALIEIGKGEYDLETFKNSMTDTSGLPIRTIAPSSGLCLNKVEFE